MRPYILPPDAIVRVDVGICIADMNGSAFRAGEGDAAQVLVFLQLSIVMEAARKSGPEAIGTAQDMGKGIDLGIHGRRPVTAVERQPIRT